MKRQLSFFYFTKNNCSTNPLKLQFQSHVSGKYLRIVGAIAFCGACGGGGGAAGGAGPAMSMAIGLSMSNQISWTWIGMKVVNLFKHLLEQIRTNFSFRFYWTVVHSHNLIGKKHAKKMNSAKGINWWKGMSYYCYYYHGF